MKKILIILLFFISFGAYAQDKIDKLSDKIDKLAEQVAETNKQILETNKQVAELAKQVAINSTEIKGVDKRLDILLYVIIGIGSTLFVSIISLVGAIFWDRQASIKPIIQDTKEIFKEINLLKERETKSENLIKRIAEKFPDLAAS